MGSREIVGKEMKHFPLNSHTDSSRDTKLLRSDRDEVGLDVGYGNSVMSYLFFR